MPSWGYDPLWLGPWLKVGPLKLVVYSMSDARFLEVLWLGRVVRTVRLSGTPSCGTSYSR